jgi:hypothetical protein
MKKIIEDLARKSGIETGYAGSTRTMYIKGPNLEKFRERIRNLYPNLPFQLKPTENLPELSTWTEEAKKLKKSKSKKTPSMLVFSGTGVDENAAQLASEIAYETVFPEESAPISQGVVDVANQLIEESTFATNLKEKENRPSSFDELDKIIKKTDKEILKDKLDEYLLANPVDRTQKDPYGAVAKLFNVKNDYVRGRYRALREKGLVEKQNETNESRS